MVLNVQRQPAVPRRKRCPFIGIAAKSFSTFAAVPRFRETIPIDDYVLDVLMRDIVGHDRQPAAYLVYLYLYGQAARAKWKPVAASLRTLAETTGLSKSAVQTALERLRRRKLIETTSDHTTAVPKHRVLRHWR